MKAVTIDRYGGPEVVQVREVPNPTLGPGQVRVKVHAASLNPIDKHIRNGDMKMMVRKPFPIVLGADMAGVVTEAAPGGRFKVGDEVWGLLPGDIGGQAEQVVVPESSLGRKPAKLSFTDAASVPATALTALQALRNLAGLKAGQSVLVNGASGGIGIFAVQLARWMGAKVTGVCSGPNVGLVKELGADEVIDYKTTDFVTKGVTWDVVLDCTSTRDFAEYRPALHAKSVYVTTAPKSWPKALARHYLLSRFVSPKAMAIIVKPSAADLDLLAKLFDEGKLRTVVDRVFSLEEILQAHQQLDSGRSRGKSVLRIQP